LDFLEQVIRCAEVVPAVTSGIQVPLHGPLLMRTYGRPSTIARRDAVAVVVLLVEPYTVDASAHAPSNR
jgi:hypothetical protein